MRIIDTIGRNAGEREMMWNSLMHHFFTSNVQQIGYSTVEQILRLFDEKAIVHSDIMGMASQEHDENSMGASRQKTLKSMIFFSSRFLMMLTKAQLKWSTDLLCGHSSIYPSQFATRSNTAIFTQPTSTYLIQLLSIAHNNYPKPLPGYPTHMTEVELPEDELSLCDSYVW